jgi:hypothetical protein
MVHTGVPFRVTSTWRAGDTGSFHSKGLAVDFAGEVPSADTDALRAIYEALRPLGPQCLELIYSGPGGGFWKYGLPMEPYAEAAHHNHVHIAMPATWTYDPPEDTVPTIAAAFSHEGGYVIIMSDGAVYCFNCDYQGGLRWDGQAWVVR